MQTSFKYSIYMNFITPNLDSSPNCRLQSEQYPIQTQPRPSFHRGLSQPKKPQVKPRFLMRLDGVLPQWNCRSKPRFDRGKIMASGPIVLSGTVPVNYKTAHPPGQSLGIWLTLTPYSGEFDSKWGPPGGAFDFRVKTSVSDWKQNDFAILWFSTWAAFTGQCSCWFHVGFSVVVVLYKS